MKKHLRTQVFIRSGRYSDRGRGGTCRNGRAFATLTARGGGLLVRVRRSSYEAFNSKWPCSHRGIWIRYVLGWNQPSYQHSSYDRCGGSYRPHRIGAEPNAACRSINKLMRRPRGSEVACWCEGLFRLLPVRAGVYTVGKLAANQRTMCRQIMSNCQRASPRLVG
jgi:hypothetical protein